MNKLVSQLIDYIKSLNGAGDKQRIIKLVQHRFNLTQDRSVYYSDEFAIRFSSSKSRNFSNTVISLSNLQKFDDLPFIVCLVTPKENILFLANTTYISKVSHSSQELRINNIRGSINGSDIVKQFNGISNEPKNFASLFAIHEEIGFAGNLERLVESTNNISPRGEKFKITKNEENTILIAPCRAKKFVDSEEYRQLKRELDEKVEMYKKEILIAGLIDNVNIRGRVIEYLIAGEDEKLRQELIRVLRENHQEIPSFRTSNVLGDYSKVFEGYETATDVKTKIVTKLSNPKGYNIDKMLEFLSHSESVFMLYFIGLDEKKILEPVLISMFQKDLLSSTLILKQWAGRNSRGVTQFIGKEIDKIIINPNNDFSLEESQKFLSDLIKL